MSFPPGSHMRGHPNTMGVQSQGMIRGFANQQQGFNPMVIGNRGNLGGQMPSSDMSMQGHPVSGHMMSSQGQTQESSMMMDPSMMQMMMPQMMAMAQMAMTQNSKKKKSSPWSKHTSPDGRTYYYNTETKQSSWSKPDELKTPSEKLLSQCPWKEHKQAETGIESCAMKFFINFALYCDLDLNLISFQVKYTFITQTLKNQLGLSLKLSLKLRKKSDN